MRNVTINMRIDQLKAMNDVILNANDEDICMTWFSIGIPDCPTEDDYEFIAECDENYNETCDLFIKLVSKKGYRC